MGADGTAAGGPTLSVPAVASSVARVRRSVADWCRARPDLDQAVVDDVVLAVSEVVTNAVEHAYRGEPGQIQVALGLDAGTVTVEVRDCGLWKDPEGEDDTRGHGLLIVRALSGETLRIDRDAEGTVVTFAVPAATTTRTPPTPVAATDPSAHQVLDEWFRRALDAMFDDVAIGESIRDESGRIVDFDVVYVNEGLVDGAGRTGARVMGRRLLELFPAALENGLFDRFVAVVETGDPYLEARLPFQDVVEGGARIDGYWSMSVARFGDGYIAATRDVTAQVAEEEARRHEELVAARNRLAVELLQAAALPAALPEVDGVDVAATYRPAHNEQPVGGDWYDVFELDDARLGVVIADVSGHGRDAAALMVQVRNIVRTLAFEHPQPEDVLAAANRMVCRISAPEAFVTCCYAVLDVASLAVRWASAGHPTPLLLGPDPRFLPTPVGVPLGVDPEATFGSSAMQVGPHDHLVLYTDGMVEERDRSIEDSLTRLLADRVGPPDSPQATIEWLLARAPTDDDLAIVCLAPATS